MKRTLFLETPENFSFRQTIYSHGWSELLPFRIDDENWILSYVFSQNSLRCAGGSKFANAQPARSRRLF